MSCHRYIWILFPTTYQTIMTGTKLTGLVSEPGRTPRLGYWLQYHTMPCSLHNPSVGPAPIRTLRVFASCDNPSTDVRNEIHHKSRLHSVGQIQPSFFDLSGDRWSQVSRLLHQDGINVVGLRDLKMKIPAVSKLDGKLLRALQLRSVALTSQWKRGTGVSQSCLQKSKTKPAMSRVYTAG